jgi:2-C-methyl-D-erythritol 2,4-cyclodiphosphate synthase
LKGKKLLEDAGYKVVNIDSVICAQKPKLSPYIDEMRTNIADTLGVTVNKISIKATTTEELGLKAVVRAFQPSNMYD